MIEEQQVTVRKLTPDTEGNWLFRDDEQGVRTFSQCVYLGIYADPAEWHECTDAEKRAWEEAHPIEESAE